MKIKNKIKTFLSLLTISLLLFSIVSCHTIPPSPTEKIQGVFMVDKVSLKSLMEAKMGTDNVFASKTLNKFASKILNKVVDNAIVEIKVKGDSIHGITFIAGNANLIISKIQIRNDSMIIPNNNSTTYLIPYEKGILLKNTNSEVIFQMLKSQQSELSDETKKAMLILSRKEKK